MPGLPVPTHACKLCFHPAVSTPSACTRLLFAHHRTRLAAHQRGGSLVAANCNDTDERRKEEFCLKKKKKESNKTICKSTKIISFYRSSLIYYWRHTHIHTCIHTHTHKQKVLCVYFLRISCQSKISPDIINEWGEQHIAKWSMLSVKQTPASSFNNKKKTAVPTVPGGHLVKIL